MGMNPLRHRLLCLSPFLLAWPAAAESEIPVVNDPALQIELFAQEPLIAQPIGMTLTPDGKLLVIQSNTHFRPPGYAGPEHDRILWLRDADGDGRAESAEVFFEGTDLTMDLATAPDGRIYVATRNEILRMKDQQGKASAVERRVVFLDSEGMYPHNGVSGLAFDQEGGLYFGLGENLGAAYTLRGAYGSQHRGQGEGGNIFHVTRDGLQLRHVATGFWNPFGICVDAQGHVFATDNDPDSRPPCRLHHIVEGGDYGYRFRYGRSGLHPFISWDGQLPGTLPMLAGTGEAPCDVISYAPPAHPAYRGLPAAWQGQLLVASWTDHTIEAYALPAPSQCFDRAAKKILVQGGADFRPVAFAVAPDGSIFVSDWVKRAYELHGFGRVWRIRAKEPTSGPASPAPDHAGIAAKQRELDAIAHTSPLSQTAAEEWLADLNPWRFAAAAQRLAREAELLKALNASNLANPRQRAGLLLATRQEAERSGAAPVRTAASFLSDPDPTVRLLALNWIADGRLADSRSAVEQIVNDPACSPEVFYAGITALNRIDSEDIKEADLVKQLKERIASPSTPARLKRAALTILPDRDRNLLVRDLAPLLDLADPEFREWLLRVAGTLRDQNRIPLLRRMAFDTSQPASVRATAIDLLPLEAGDIEPLLQAAQTPDPHLRRSAVIALETAALTEPQRQTLEPLLAVRGPVLSSRPPFTDTTAWRAFLRGVPGKPDLERGRRLFFNPRLGTCTVCHRVDGIGASAGPELSTIGAAAAPDYVLESLLQPSRNLAPGFESYVLETTDGQTRTAFQLMERGGTHTYVGLDGKPFEVRIEEILKRLRLPVSIMPEGLVTRFHDEELRDLVAWLESKR